ncbi:hypothetical protein [Actinoplanes sp. NPDC051859]|uniref:hypothetical protein n=1 Tax=Actinoplanes sp. NPDC051859 TaxID=3363909 RepID=UPI0037AD166E
MKYRTFSVRAAITLLGATAILSTGQAAASAKDWRIDAQAEIDAYTDAHPTDYVGRDRLLVKYGLPPMQVRIDGIGRDLTAAEAQKEMNARKAAESKAPAAISIRAVPTDAFSVSVTINYDLYLNRVVVGSWNFRDNFVNGSNPDDVATVQANLGSCFRTGSMVRKAADYTGKDYTGNTYVDDGGVNGSPIFGVRDRVSGFKMLTDNGYFRVTYNKTNASGCGSAKMGAQFQYEHNQDGGSGFSASAGWGFFSVSYGGAANNKLRKSTDPLWL